MTNSVQGKKNDMKLVYRKRSTKLGRCLVFTLISIVIAVFGDDGLPGFLDDDLNYTFGYGSESQVYVKGLRNKAATHITIPATVIYRYYDYYYDDSGHRVDVVKYRTCTVMEIDYGASFTSSALESLTIADGVKGGIYGWLSGCDSLKSLTIGNGITFISRMAFRGFSSLEHVTIGNGLKIIGDHAFERCANLANVVMGNDVRSIEQGAFSGCFSLMSMTVPNSVTNLGDYAFETCTNLTTVTIGNGVKSIGSGVFSSCYNLTNMAIPNVVTNIGGAAFKYCRSLTSVTIPDNVKSIGIGAFWGCSGLTEVMIGRGVTTISDEAFVYCSGLRSFQVAGGNPSYKTVSGMLLTKDGIELAFGLNGDLEIPNCVEKIWDEAFRGYNVTSLIIPSSVTTIEPWAFYDCRKLSKVDFQGSPPVFNGNFYHSVGCIGTYTAEHTTEWEAVIDENGYWHGLNMSRYEPSPLTLSASDGTEPGGIEVTWTGGGCE